MTFRKSRNIDSAVSTHAYFVRYFSYLYIQISVEQRLNCCLLQRKLLSYSKTVALAVVAM